MTPKCPDCKRDQDECVCNDEIESLRAENKALHTKLAQFTKWNSELTAKCNWYNCDGARLEREIIEVRPDSGDGFDHTGGNMTLDEAIAHADEKAGYETECRREHGQLAGWLRELKDVRAAHAELVALKAMKDEMSLMLLREEECCFRDIKSHPKRRMEGIQMISESMHELMSINDQLEEENAALRAEVEHLQMALAELESLRKDAVPAGWCFYHADFSLQAAGKSKVGTVTFIRDAVGREWWHSLPEEQQEKTPLYIYGKGRTVMEAIAAAPKEK